MSQPQASGSPRYQRSSGGLVGAMIVTVIAVVAFAGFRGFFRDNEETPVRRVDWTAQERAGRADGKLAVLAPERLPVGWEATSATYRTGVSPAWHLGLLTGSKKYVGLEESRSEVSDLVEEHVDPNATRGKDVTLGGTTWQVWTDTGGDYGLARTFEGPGRQREAVLVVGSAGADDVRRFAGSLGTG